jgi:DNA-binding NtrC family response regulator
MILLISSLDKAKACAEALEQASHESVELCSGLHEAMEKLETQEFSAVVFDLLLLEAEPDEGEAIFKHLGSAVPVYLNFAVAGIARVVRELRSALQRRRREMLTANREAAQALRRELNDSITALLLSCEMALRVPDLPQQAESKMHDVEVLAKELSTKLGAA